MTWWFQKQLEDLLIMIRWKKYPKDKYYRIAEEYPGFLPVEILEGAYKGTVFTIKDIKILDDYGKTKFEHVILKKIPGKHDSYYGEQFSKLVGDILVNCLTEAQANYSTVRDEVLNDEADGNDYSEEPVEERTVSSKGPTVPKA